MTVASDDGVPKPTEFRGVRAIGRFTIRTARCFTGAPTVYFVSVDGRSVNSFLSFRAAARWVRGQAA